MLVSAEDLPLGTVTKQGLDKLESSSGMLRVTGDSTGTSVADEIEGSSTLINGNVTGIPFSQRISADGTPMRLSDEEGFSLKKPPKKEPRLGADAIDSSHVLVSGTSVESEKKINPAEGILSSEGKEKEKIFSSYRNGVWITSTVPELEESAIKPLLSGPIKNIPQAESEPSQGSTVKKPSKNKSGENPEDPLQK